MNESNLNLNKNKKSHRVQKIVSRKKRREKSMRRKDLMTRKM